MISYLCSVLFFDLFYYSVYRTYSLRYIQGESQHIFFIMKRLHMQFL